MMLEKQDSRPKGGCPAHFTGVNCGRESRVVRVPACFGLPHGFLTYLITVNSVVMKEPETAVAFL